MIDKSIKRELRNAILVHTQIRSGLALLSDLISKENTNNGSY